MKTNSTKVWLAPDLRAGHVAERVTYAVALANRTAIPFDHYLLTDVRRSAGTDGSADTRADCGTDRATNQEAHARANSRATRGVRGRIRIRARQAWHCDQRRGGSGRHQDLPHWFNSFVSLWIRKRG